MNRSDEPSRDDQDGDRKPPSGDVNAQPWMRVAGMGMELAGSVLGLAAIGYLIDRYRGQDDRYGTAIGALIGFVFGMIRFLQKAMNEINQQSKGNR